MLKRINAINYVAQALCQRIARETKGRGQKEKKKKKKGGKKKLNEAKKTKRIGEEERTERNHEYLATLVGPRQNFLPH